GYAGEERCKARDGIVSELETAGLLVRVDKHRHAVGVCYRCHTVVEPNVSKQWFVKVAPLAKPAIDAVKQGRVRFVPGRWENLYNDWMENIKDWCISRQIWWGHRIPAWTCLKCGEIMVLRDDPDECVKCGCKELEQESDVLDTWFSSALWPFSTLGWPDKTEALKTFYPTSVLVTSFDIIFFWVARMIMMGLKFTGEVPFREVYIHALVRDAEGKKMSKSKGNVVDPLEIMSRYGSDAMRMTLAAFAAQGRDIKLSEERIEGYRNFTNKLWNASRFALMNLKDFDFSKTDVMRDDLDLADRWILSRMQRAILGARKSIDEYRFNDTAHILYQFIWREFCDWYLEMIKPRLYGHESGGDAARHVMAKTLETTLRLLHPIMPFITEELWQKVKPDGDLVGRADYPVYEESFVDETIERDMNTIIDITTTIRNIRGELSIKPSTTLKAAIYAKDDPGLKEIISRQAPYISKLANIDVSLIANKKDRPEQSAAGVSGKVEVFVDLAGIAGEKERRAKTRKELEKVEKEIYIFTKKLSNKKFVENAPPEIVKKNREKLKEYEGKAEKLRENAKQG
ncbi:MAG TPA: valine--tRNA ligase, partial [Nitrospirae bacterium]|nr:valine--tRNA ligase [Nitrospirota bacterium]